MLLRSTQSMKTVQVIPSGEGQRPSGPGVGCGIWNKPTPALRATPPMEGFPWEHQLQESALPPPANSFPPKKCAARERQGWFRTVSCTAGGRGFPLVRVVHTRQRQKLGEAERRVRIKPWLGGSFASDDEFLCERFSTACGRARLKRHHAVS